MCVSVRSYPMNMVKDIEVGFRLTNLKLRMVIRFGVPERNQNSPDTS